MLKWFKVLIKWLKSESGAELYTLTELHSKMVEFSDGDDVYTIKRLKQRLQEHYKELIFYANVEGRENVVCFKNMATGKYIINEKWQSSRNGMEDKVDWIKTHDSESRGQEEAGRTRRMSVLFTGSTAVKLVNALNKPP